MIRALVLLVSLALLATDAYIIPPASNGLSLQTRIHEPFVSKSKFRGSLYMSTEDEEPSKPSPPKPPSPPKDDTTDDSLMEQLKVQVEMADAQEELKALSAEKVKKAEAKLTSKLTSEQQVGVLAAGIGGAGVGLILGGIIDLNIPNLDLIMSPLIPPVFGSIAFSVLGFAGGSSDGQVGTIVRATFGGPVRMVASAIINLSLIHI